MTGAMSRSLGCQLCRRVVAEPLRPAGGKWRRIARGNRWGLRGFPFRIIGAAGLEPATSRPAASISSYAAGADALVLHISAFRRRVFGHALPIVSSLWYIAGTGG